ncbi:Dihydrofolate reductase [Penicillium taxi]|uniref:Dihydrofolate reductase n=1 Tax=Penicillium taxi TaxID=168475 RepID=UPI0025455CFC|nr:Dihydrofolate reductase [Penicillium taxi]KAJ5885165.1 Dihydrofolate reductase [Penicillium taxi]
MAANPSITARKPLKLLMLHGYTQTGPLFYAKSRALQKAIQKAFPLYEVKTVVPTGPIRLKPIDIPGYEPSGNTDEEDVEAYGWFLRSSTATPTLYAGLEDCFKAVAKTLTEEGPFDGVIGFSQGAALAAMVTSLLEPGRKEAFEKFSKDEVDGATGIPYPPAFLEPGFVHPPFKFALAYCGYRAPGARYRGFYEDPAIQTPLLHVLGSLDAIVEESKSQALIDACAGEPEKVGWVVRHPGGHFLPSQKPYLEAATRFIKGQLEKTGVADKVDEEDVNDMDVPF